ncbi:O-acetyl-ADP-ribose deacetylase (regulator of RNase III) [Melghiribacillus thermohalophilus]|uniref:O-acetyl-ADP-ribose deacetylase (Regulator of RNase III) n=1 Tax=Melghiribacillus thermohalophilus TaxID=1324956 RepID=A0A4R3MVX1_9BACI|nr:O-acetyl-ADP-ribose deacetylase [Melghiribacillus thermohalophilus]TCT19656.1 O-acetyl-ADP-ribose deacetylase (regulator of RNase III) [Melghiribacillus thermohalophilus]
MTAIDVIKGDISRIEVDAIVNAANEQLAGGGGVDGAIHRAGGPAIMEECRQIGGCPTGEAVMTTAGNLPAKKVIHTVGPIWRGGNQNEARLLASCYRQSMELAVKQNLYTIAFPNISTGVYGYPKEEAAGVAIKTVREFIKKKKGLEKVMFVCFDEENYRLYKKVIKEWKQTE